MPKKLCENSPKYKMICKTTAKKQYHLTNDDILSMDTIEVKNPHYKCTSEMILLNEQEVIECACENLIVRNFIWLIK